MPASVGGTGGGVGLPGSTGAGSNAPGSTQGLASVGLPGEFNPYLIDSAGKSVAFQRLTIPGLGQFVNFDFLSPYHYDNQADDVSKPAQVLVGDPL
jgi:hypothetical protein